MQAYASIDAISVLFNEPKLLKCNDDDDYGCERDDFSALQRAEIAEIDIVVDERGIVTEFQCSSTSRNC